MKLLNCKVKITKMSWAPCFTPLILATQEAEIRRIKASPGKFEDPISKIPNTKQGWQSDLSGRATASKCEVMSSNPSTAIKINKNNF
jgi:hypothetical protein